MLFFFPETSLLLRQLIGSNDHFYHQVNQNNLPQDKVGKDCLLNLEKYGRREVDGV